jgi:hypothetical protein
VIWIAPGGRLDLTHAAELMARVPVWSTR